ncbi:glycosyltransferase family 4 protein [Flavobacterium capsici]|uniref:Glycosyltransferase family 4 protein n=1 Tax=Flavobacterium capsici TaxID=3075618 RepID=A0AA96EW66_9FLAO|nr:MULTISPECIES: glycosyltransferase family 4 protein [unclassified Flavobacterium]WNM17890.1 glycosyltransferase family 4 protein [Flavobacterium sp. PMR2A8]WNM21943.1 glycosyltransferase family 4 protein [Flavobacterium sp. PMTSA4]
MSEPKKLLIITYYWPPAGGPGVQRWLKFVKYLPDFNIQPIVYIPENPTYPIIDKGLESEVSNETIILKNKIKEPYGFASFFGKNKTKKISSGIIPNKKKQSFLEKTLLWIRGNLFIPDARFLWVKPSVKYLKKYIEENNIDTIVTSGPPHSLHLIGLQLKKDLGVKWFADFRDPWTTIGYHKALKLSSYAEKKHKALESAVLNAADTILVTSKTTKTEFQELTSKPIEVITNGYDVEKVTKRPLDEKFTLAHIGSFLSERNPRILWKALSELIKENKDFKNDFQLKLIGAVSQEVLDTISEFKLNDYVLNLGYVSHQEAIEQQRKSQVLLLIEINSEETKSIIPGKVFEYMVSERPIIALGPEGSDFAEIITTTNTGVFFTYDEKEKLKTVLLNYYELYQNNNLKVHAVGLQQYSRKNLTEQLAKLVTRK